MVKRWCAMVLAGAAVLGAAEMAEACSCIEPCPETLLESGSSIPANTPGFAFATRYVYDENIKKLNWIVRDAYGDGVYSTEIYTIDEEPEYFHSNGLGQLHLLQPERVLEPGAYVISSPESGCRYDAAQNIPSTVYVKEAAAFPVELGDIIILQHQVGMVQVPSTECSEELISSYFDFYVDLSEGAEYWKDALFFSTLVDGERWEELKSVCALPPLGAPSGERGAARLFTLCGQSYPGLEPGRHTVKFTAWLPGTDIVLETEEVEFELDCTELEAQLAAANPGDGAPDEGEATSADEEDAGCNVSPPSGVTSGGWLGLGLAGLGVWAGLRRR
jgi:MYXO-CTERM domain-containing protein